MHARRWRCTRCCGILPPRIQDSASGNALVAVTRACATISLMIPRRIGSLLLFLGAAYGAAALGSAFTLPALDGWYRRLRRPAWTPPDQVFGPVWTVLYTLMAVAAWRLRVSKASSGAALVAWGMQLSLNVGWSAAFFGRRSTAAGLAVIVPLWVAIATTIALSARVSRVAALLLLPYLAWTTFAAALNARVWSLNRSE